MTQQQPTSETLWTTIYSFAHPTMLFKAICLMLLLCAVFPTNLPAAISDVPLFLTTASKANVLVVLDNSNSMDEAADGSAVGSNSANSKSEIARSVIKYLVTTYTGTINMGLMAYRLNTLTAYYLHNSPYDVSYNPANYDSTFTGPRESTTKRLRIPNPTDAGNYVYYNVGLPMYDPTDQGISFCYGANAGFPNIPGGGNNNYRCYHNKTGASSTADGSDTLSSSGYTNHFWNVGLGPTDSDTAQGISSFGERLMWSVVGKTWFRNDSPGRGYLHVPIKDLNAAQATSLNAKLACNIPETPTPCTSTGIQNAGYTPIEGTLLTAKDYFSNSASVWSNTSEGYVASVYPLLTSCGKNFAILVTDGLPSTNASGATITNPTTAITDAAAAAAALKTQGVETYVVGFALPYGVAASTLNTIAVAGGTNTAYYATDSTTLKAALDAIFIDIKFKTATAASIATNSTRLDTDTLIYQAKFDSSDWSGRLIAYKINADGSIGTSQWDTDNAGSIPSNLLRNIYSWNGSTGVDFKAIDTDWNSLSDAQRSALQNGVLTAAGVTAGKNRLDWIRGDQTNEQPSGVLRKRTRILGDIINSDPIFVGSSNFGYDLLPSGTGGQSDYATFKSGNNTRTKVLYVGGNDGMLHAFNALTGVEKFAFIPNSVFVNLASLTAPGYSHKYFVDGSPYVGDAYIGAWKTILLGTTGAGGKSVFALDVTSPDSFDKTKVLWEFTDADLGYTIGQPVIGRMKDGNWAAIFGNGYNSTSQKAFLYVVNLETGILIKKIDTEAGGASTPNGLASPALRANDTRIIEYAYAGDLLGNVWKFDLTATSPGNASSGWGVAFKQGSTPKPLFQPRYVTTSPAAQIVQPITAPVEIAKHPSGGYLIVFGTGKYFETGDTANTDVQSLYGIWDKDDTSSSDITETDRSTLVRQTILFELGTNNLGAVTTVTADQVNQWRVVSKNTIDWGSNRGWYLDLLYPFPGGTPKGERVVSSPIIHLSRAIFTTLIPSSDPCDWGGTSWIIEVDMVTGGRLDYSVFDVNQDKKFNTTDYVTVTGIADPVPVSGVQSTAGIIKTPSIIPAGELEFKFAGGSTGEVWEAALEKGDAGGGRQSWRQVR